MAGALRTIAPWTVRNSGWILKVSRFSYGTCSDINARADTTTLIRMCRTATACEFLIYAIRRFGQGASTLIGRVIQHLKGAHMFNMASAW